MIIERQKTEIDHQDKYIKVLKEQLCFLAKENRTLQNGLENLSKHESQRLKLVQMKDVEINDLDSKFKSFKKLYLDSETKLKKIEGEVTNNNLTDVLKLQSEIHILAKDLNESQDLRRKQAGELNKLKAERAEFSDKYVKIHEFEEKLRENESLFSQKDTQISELRKELEDVKDSLVKKDSLIEDQRQKIEFEASVRHRYKNMYKDGAEKIFELEKKTESIKEEFVELRLNHHQLKLEKEEEANRIREECEKRVKELKDEQKVLEMKVKEIIAESKEKEKKNESKFNEEKLALTQEIQQLEEIEIPDLKEEKRLRILRLSELEDENEYMEQKISKLAATIEELSQGNHKLSNQVENLQTENNRLSNQAHNLIIEKDALSKNVESLNQTVLGLKNQIKIVKQEYEDFKQQQIKKEAKIVESLGIVEEEDSILERSIMEVKRDWMDKMEEKDDELRQVNEILNNHRNEVEELRKRLLMRPPVETAQIIVDLKNQVKGLTKKAKKYKRLMREAEEKLENFKEEYGLDENE